MYEEIINDTIWSPDFVARDFSKTNDHFTNNKVNGHRSKEPQRETPHKFRAPRTDVRNDARSVTRSERKNEKKVNFNHNRTLQRLAIANWLFLV